MATEATAPQSLVEPHVATITATPAATDEVETLTVAIEAMAP